MKIIYFAPIYYDSLKQRPQHIAELLAEKHIVYYIEPTISLMKYVLKGGKTYKGMSYNVTDNLRVIRLDGKYIVHKSLEILDFLNLNTISEFYQLNTLVKKCDIVWVGYAGWYNLIRRFKTLNVVYDKMDDDYKITTNLLLKKLLIKVEQKLIRDSSLIFVTCQSFFARIKPRNESTCLVRNGVTYTFGDGCWGPVREDRVFGYVGTISHWFDFDIIQTILDENEKNQVILVGQNEMPVMRNKRILYIKSVDKQKIPGIIASFDICLYNFCRTDLLDTIDPVKVYEYLALNQPVLAVKSEETQRFDDKIMVYETKEDVVFYLRNEIKRPFENESERMLFLKENSWETRVELIQKELEKLICKREV